MEGKLQTSLYKIELHWIKIIPMMLSAFTFADTILSYLCIETAIIAYINALLVWLFLYLSSFVFKFCAWHRTFLYYLLIEGVVNWYDYTYIIPLNLKTMIVIQLGIVMTFVSIGLYLYKHDKLPCKRDCCKTLASIR